MTWSGEGGSQQEDFHSNRIEADRISIDRPPRPFDRVLLLKVLVNLSITRQPTLRVKMMLKILTDFLRTYNRESFC